MAELQHDYSQEQPITDEHDAIDAKETALLSPAPEITKKDSVLASLQEKKDEARSDTTKESKKKTPVKGTHAKKKGEAR